MHTWLDRRITDRGSTFHQITTGAEWLGESVDVLLNGYWPISSGKEYVVPNADPQGPAIAGTGIVVDTTGTLIEEPQRGFDIELGWELGKTFSFVRDHTDSVRVYGGAYVFDGDNTERVSGWRGRVAADVTSDIQIGGCFQWDDERGSQGFLEATFRFPFGQKKSFRKEGLRARLDESPERDIDIVTGAQVADPGDRVPLINTETGQPQKVLTVDNSAAAGGDGSAEAPFNTLAAAEAAASENTIIYVRRGDGTATGQNAGITLDDRGQQLIGSGVDFVLDVGAFRTANGRALNIPNLVIAEAGAAPVIGNVNAGQDGVTVNADNVTVAGLIVDNANTGRDGIVVRASGAGTSAQNVTIQDVTARNARMGIYLHGADGGAVSAKVQRSVATSNSQHGIAVYDDTASKFEVDLGGGAMGSVGRNVLAGNILEDLAVDYDGRTLAAQNNWWGQASGPDTDTPDIGIRPQIYYGAPINDGLVGHYTYDYEWVNGTTFFDRSKNSVHANGIGGLNDGDLVTTCESRQCIFLDTGPKQARLNDISHFPTDEITVINWVNMQNHTNWYNHVNNNWSSASNPMSWLLFTSGTGNVIFGLWGTPPGNPQRNAFKPGVPLNEWVMLSGTYDGNVISASFNDETPVDNNIGNFTLRNSGNTDFGDTTGGAELPYFSDDTRIYSRALDASEISELYRMDTSSSVNTSEFLANNP